MQSMHSQSMSKEVHSNFHTILSDYLNILNTTEGISDRFVVFNKFVGIAVTKDVSEKITHLFDKAFHKKGNNKTLIKLFKMYLVVLPIFRKDH